MVTLRGALLNMFFAVPKGEVFHIRFPHVRPKKIPRVGEMDDMKVLSLDRPTIAVCGDAHGQSLGNGPEYSKYSPWSSKFGQPAQSSCVKEGRVDTKPSGRFWSALESWQRKPAALWASLNAPRSCTSLNCHTDAGPFVAWPPKSSGAMKRSSTGLTVHRVCNEIQSASSRYRWLCRPFVC